MTESKIFDLIKQHESMRLKGVNLVVSENYISEPVRRALASDLCARYDAEWYAGTSVSRELIQATEELAKKTFNAKHAMVSSLSGNMCLLAVLYAFSKPKDKVAMLPFTHGGYPFGFSKFDRKHRPLPAVEGTLDIDVEAAKKMHTEEEIPLTIFGASGIPFPHPVAPICEHIKNTDPSRVAVFDGSHVLGLIACNTFQNPLAEGADVLIGSTHKSFYGPQGGLILTNRDDCAEAIRPYLGFDLDSGLGLVDNIHVSRVAALGVALEEILGDQGYGQRVINNSKALARALDEKGAPVRFKDRGYTESHQVHLDLSFEKSTEYCHDLEKVGIFTDIGGRVGTAEVTHRGADPEWMALVAGLMAEVYENGPSEGVSQKCRKAAETLQQPCEL